ncbi:S49 family peptidase [Telmatocola sphagniphila]|uniref:S49 family peptidase n=1 Tax=Telmatocola sphagniphila TaxID=1123043 RepID=A0A8E6B5R4_9BACT|nr:S49 family peptidase [Telmatocola sphagniphila]QVL31964.1 S49 family peptidase [Telmatocola sphagniphila]
MAEKNQRPLQWIRILLFILVMGSFAANLVLCVALNLLVPKDELLVEYPYKGQNEKTKIAIVKIDGLLMEGFLDFAHEQIEQVCSDPHVKAVVLRINSPGGTISASEVLHREITAMAKGTHRFSVKDPRPLVISMGALAASGGYYVAMPGEYIFAENYCLTGSIGVYASLPNIAEFGKKYGLKMELIKAGDIKASGSPFHEMTPSERAPWQEMVDNAYDQFLEVVQNGRPKLTKAKLTDVLFQKEVPERNDKGEAIKDAQGKPQFVRVQRKLADGGTYTAKQALEYGLIDEIGTLDQAIEKAATLANISNYKVIVYQKHLPIWEQYLGLKVKQPSLNPAQLANLFVPRGWMIMPGADLSAILSGGSN